MSGLRLRGLMATHRRYGPAHALVPILGLWFLYTALQTLLVLERLSEPLYAVLGFVPGILAILVLLNGGLDTQDCYLRIVPISRKGFLVLAMVFVFSLVTILPFGEWAGWNWPKMFVYAPAGGVSQELFFRSSLMPAMLFLLKERQRSALVIHSVLFSLWHIGPLFMGTPIPAVAAIMLVPFIAGIGWGWQVKHDGTVLWAMVQHSLIWMVGSPFVFGG